MFMVFAYNNTPVEPAWVRSTILRFGWFSDSSSSKFFAPTREKFPHFPVFFGGRRPLVKCISYCQLYFSKSKQIPNGRGECPLKDEFSLLIVHRWPQSIAHHSAYQLLTASPIGIFPHSKFQKTDKLINSFLRNFRVVPQKRPKGAFGHKSLFLFLLKKVFASHPLVGPGYLGRATVGNRKTF